MNRNLSVRAYAPLLRATLIGCGLLLIAGDAAASGSGTRTIVQVSGESTVVTRMNDSGVADQAVINQLVGVQWIQKSRQELMSYAPRSIPDEMQGECHIKHIYEFYASGRVLIRDQICNDWVVHAGSWHLSSVTQTATTINLNGQEKELTFGANELVIRDKLPRDKTDVFNELDFERGNSLSSH